MARSSVFGLKRVVCILFFLGLFNSPITVSAQGSVTLSVLYGRAKGILRVNIDPSFTSSSCAYKLYGSPTKSKLSGDLSALQPLFESPTQATELNFSVLEPKSLKRRKRKVLPAYFVAQFECRGRTTITSNLDSVAIATRSDRGTASLASWLKGFARLFLKRGVSFEEIFPALSFINATDIQNAGDNRLFISQVEGLINVFDNTSTVSSSSIFLDLSDKVNREGEEGLLGFAFHPSFKSNGYLFVQYSRSGDATTVISRFSANTDRTSVDPTTEEIFIEVPQTTSIHKGGQLAFGPDGYLYAALGDGGPANDANGNGQNLSTLLGKFIRIDVDTAAGATPYSIPSDNPFLGNGLGYREEIFAYGLRNPFRFSFDSQTGDLWTGDVGQNRFEEIDLISLGGNYGWSIVEGETCFNPISGCSTSGLVTPVAVYGRGYGYAVIGGYVYHGLLVPALSSAYIYADYVSGWIFGIRKVRGDRYLNLAALDTDLDPATFGVDSSGELYFTSYSSGKIYRFKNG